MMDDIDRELYETLIAIKVMADRLAKKVEEENELLKQLEDDAEILEMLS